MIMMLWSGEVKRGSKKELVNYRGIFLTLIVTKVFENLLKGRMKEDLKKVNLHQAGSQQTPKN